MNKEKRDAATLELLDVLGGASVKVVVHSIARGNLKPMYSAEERVFSKSRVIKRSDRMRNADSRAKEK